MVYASQVQYGSRVLASMAYLLLFVNLQARNYHHEKLLQPVLSQDTF